MILERAPIVVQAGQLGRRRDVKTVVHTRVPSVVGKGSHHRSHFLQPDQRATELVEHQEGLLQHRERMVYIVVRHSVVACAGLEHKVTDGGKRYLQSALGPDCVEEVYRTVAKLVGRADRRYTECAPLKFNASPLIKERRRNKPRARAKRLSALCHHQIPRSSAQPAFRPGRSTRFARPNLPTRTSCPASCLAAPSDPSARLELADS